MFRLSCYWVVRAFLLMSVFSSGFAAALSVSLASFNTSAQTGTVFDVDLVFSDDATFFWDHLSAPKGGVIGNRRTITHKRRYRFRYTVTATGSGSEYQIKLDGAVWNSSGDLVGQKIFIGSTPDTIPPVVVISGVPEYSNGPFTAKFLFSESVSFKDSDVVYGNATGSELASISSKEYTVVVTPTDQGEVTVSLGAGAVLDGAGNGNESKQAVSLYDSISPTLVIGGVPVISRTTFNARFTFSEDVIGFTAASISLGNATKGAFVTVNAKEYTLVIRPTEDGEVTVDVAENVTADTATNGNEAAIQAVSTYDVSRPTVKINGVPAKSNTAFIATIVFNEAVIGFSEGDITVAGANLSAFTRLSGDKYTVVVTPTAAVVILNVEAGVATDVAGSKNEASARAESAYDFVKPTVTMSGVPAKSNAVFTVTIAFSENVIGFSEGDITVVGANLSAFTAVAGDKYTVAVTPTAAIVTLNVAADVDDGCVG